MTTPMFGLDQYQISSKDLVCPHCKKKVLETDDICINCGEFLITEEEQQELMKQYNEEVETQSAHVYDTPTFGEENIYSDVENEYEDDDSDYYSPPTSSKEKISYGEISPAIKDLNKSIKFLIDMISDLNDTIKSSKNDFVSISNMYNKTIMKLTDNLSQFPTTGSPSKESDGETQSPKRGPGRPRKTQTFLTEESSNQNTVLKKNEALAELMKIKGIGESKAMKLYTAGITSIEKLKNMRNTTKNIKACGGKSNLTVLKNHAKEHLENQN